MRNRNSQQNKSFQSQYSKNYAINNRTQTNDKKIYLRKDKMAETIGESRFLDNHYSQSIHEKSWIVQRKTPEKKYIYGDSGLANDMTHFKMKNYREKWDIIEEIEKRNKATQIRQFPEYNHVEDKDIILTIEYCTNCAQHQNSLRHNQEQYFKTAQKLRDEVINAFPMIKVLLKPLIFDPVDKSLESLSLQRRIGVFQVQFTSIIKQKLKTLVVFSKAQAQAFPVIANVLETITECMPRHSLKIQLNLEGFQDKINGVQVNLIPLKSIREQQIQMKPSKSFFNASSIHQKTQHSFSINQRPVSGKTIKNQTTEQTIHLSSLNKKSKKKAPYQQKISGRLYQAFSNKQGLLVIDQLPLDVYLLEIMETNDFLKERKVINLIEMNDLQLPFLINIQLKPQTIGHLHIVLVDKQEGVQNSKIEVKQKLQKPIAMLENPPQTGKYEICLDPGNWEVIIKTLQYGTQKKMIQVKVGSNQFQLDVSKLDQQQNQKQKEPIQQEIPKVQAQEQEYLQEFSQRESDRNNQQLVRSRQQSFNESKQISKQPSQTSIQKSSARSENQLILTIYNIFTNQAVGNAQISIIVNDEIIYESKTDSNGNSSIPLQMIQNGILKLSKSGYLDNFVELFEFYNNLSQLQYSLIKKIPEDQFDIFINDISKTRNFKFFVITPNEEILEDNSNFQNVDISFNYTQTGGFVKFKNLKQFKQGGFRIYVTFENSQSLITNKNILYLQNSEACQNIEIPKLQKSMIDGDKIFWDIGFLNGDEFIEMSAFTNQTLTNKYCLKEYQDLIQFIKNSKNVNFDVIMGFGQKSKYDYEDDLSTTKKKILASLDKYGFEVNELIDHLIFSSKQEDGLYSLNKLKQKFLKDIKIDDDLNLSDNSNESKSEEI